MEGVEDIPGTALHEGIDWQWESFARVPRRARRHPPGARRGRAGPPRRAAGLRHGRAGPRGAHGRGDRPPWPTSPRRRSRAGAVGFTTSRTILHRSRHGLVPGTDAAPDELLVIADAMGRAGHGVFQLVSDHQGVGDESAWLAEVGRRTGGTVSYSLAQTRFAPTAYRDALEAADELRADGLDVVPQVACRPTGMLFGLRSSLHPFIAHPLWRELAEPAPRRAGRPAAPARGAGGAAGPGTGHHQPRRADPHGPVGPDVPPGRPPRLRAASLGQRGRPRRARGPPSRGGRARLHART